MNVYEQQLYVSQRLREAKERCGKSYRQLSRETMISVNTIASAMRNDGQNPRADTLAALCRAMGVSADWVLGLRGESPHPLITQEDMITNHSDTEIVKGCISLMQELTGRFEEYLDFMGIEPENDEERFCTKFSYFEIVQRLLLWTTHHSGGTSTIAKCRKLGFDSGKLVFFEDERGMEDEE